MDLIIVFLVIALIVRIMLDLSSMIRPSYVFDACYAVPFLVVGLAEFVMGDQAVFGCVSIVLGIASSLFGFHRYKKQLRPNDDT